MVVQMQSYKNYSKESGFAKTILLEFIDYIRFKIENDRLTLGEIESIVQVLESNLNLVGTIDDFARFFGKSKDNIKVVICRKVASHPTRAILHSFPDFLQSIPRVWHGITKTKDTQANTKEV